MKSVRVLFIDHSGELGGGQLGLKRFLESQPDLDIHLVLFSGGPLVTVAAELGIPVEVLEIPNNHLRMLLSGWKVRDAINRIRPDIVVTNSMRAANLVGIWRGRTQKYACYLREDLSKSSISGLKRWVMFAGPLRRFDSFISNSLYTASTIPRLLDRKPVQLAYPVCGLPAQTDRDIHSGISPLRILSLSRIAHWKGIHVLIEAIKILDAKGLGREFEVTIAGSALFEDPEYFKQMVDLASTLKVKIDFLGHVDDTTHLLESHDVLAHCSIRAEPFGQVVPQGMSHGLFTVATNMGGPLEIIDHGKDGWLVEPESPEELAAVFEYILRQPVLATELRINGSMSAARFSDESTSAALELAIKALSE